MLSQLKSLAPNLYILIVAVSISLWFEGVATVIRHYVPNRDLKAGIIMCSVALGVFLLDDGSLNELYNIEPKKDKLTRHAPAHSATRID